MGPLLFIKKLNGKMKTFRGDDGLYHYLYKTTNRINGKYYIGIHSTDDLDDGYLGSGTYLKRAIKRYGRSNFSKQILSFYLNRRALSKAERGIVTETIVTDPQSYNLVLGGDSVIDSGGFSTGMVTVKNKDGQTFLVRKDDPKYISGEYKFIRTGIGVYRDANGNIINTSKHDPRVLNGELVGTTKGFIVVQEKNTGKFVSIKKELFDKSKHIIRFTNMDGRKYYRWLKKDDQIISVHVSEVQRYIDNGWLPGNHHKGLVCITKDGQNMRIRASDVQRYIDNGWLCGTNQAYNSSGAKYKGTTYVHKDGICKRIEWNDIIDYLNDGWKCGMKQQAHHQYMNNGKINKVIQAHEFEQYVRNGWRFGKIQK